MRRHHQLGPLGGGAALLCQLGQQARMQEVLRFLDSDERRRRRVVQQDEVCQQLEGAVRCKSRKHWLVERSVFDLKEQAPVEHGLGQHTFDSWNAASKYFKDPFKLCSMALCEELNHVGEVVARFGQSLLWPGLGLPARTIGRQIGNVPAGNEIPKCRDSGVLGELPQCVDRQQVG